LGIHVLINPSPPLSTSLPMIFGERNSKEIIEIDEKDIEKSGLD
jgi:hypothetical protein